MAGLVLNIPRHSLLINCGPTKAGKSHLSAMIKAAADKKGVSCVVISADTIREDLLNEGVMSEHADLHRHSHHMSQVSRQAFHLLEAKLKAMMSYPVSCEIVIVDSTGLNPEFRQMLVNYARQFHYQVHMVLFDYKRRADYYKYIDVNDGDVRRIVHDSVDRFRSKVLANLKAREYDSRIRVQSHVDYLDLNVGPETDCNWTIPKEESYAIIGDSHECVDELKALMAKLVEAGVKTVIIDGDYLDKGGKTKEMVDYIYSLVTDTSPDSPVVILIAGNHENYNYKRMTGELVIDREMEAAKFSAAAYLESDPVTAAKFKELWESYTLPFIRVRKKGAPEVIVTHAPCEEKYLGKYDSMSARQQRNLLYVNELADYRDAVQHIFKEADSTFPIHVFGHVAHARFDRLGFKNKVFLDTGCVYGGRLTAMVVQKDGWYNFMHVNAAKVYREARGGLTKDMNQPKVPLKPFDIRDYDLDARDFALLGQVHHNDIKFISGTMAPAPSTNMEIESLEAGIKYFLNRGVNKLIAEPKYMGSRITVYFRKGVDKNGQPAKHIAVSRGGWAVRHVEGLQEYLDSIFPHYEASIPFENELILDGELLPWTALGQGLIDKDFLAYKEMVSMELDTLMADPVFMSHQCGRDHLVGDRSLLIKEFGTTLDRFLKDIPLEFKPFDILSVDGKIPGLTPEQAFAKVNPDTCWVAEVGINEAGEVTNLDGFLKFFNTLTLDRGMEGLVLKPLDEVPGTETQKGIVPPFMKVRSEQYLMLVYGYDYALRYEDLCRQKNISGKMRTSVREWKLGQEMLVCPPENRRECAVKLIAEVKTEATLDPRL